MIKTNILNEVKVKPFWNTGSGSKPVRDAHATITYEPFVNIICCAKKKSGKTTLALHLIIKHFMTPATKLVVFSPDILNDKDNVNAIRWLMKKYGRDNVTIHPRFHDSEGNSLFLQEVEEASDAFHIENESKYEYPRTIFYFDDLNEEDLKSKDIGHFSQNLRHYGALCIYSSQEWINFEPRVRKAGDIFLLWGSIPKERLKEIYSTCQPGVRFEEFEKLYNYAVAGERTNFLFVDAINKKFRKNLSEELYIKDI